MKAFAAHKGVALPLMIDNINTDVIIPSREMKRVSKTGLAEGLFANIRYTDNKRQPEPAFLMNKPEYAGASVLLLGRNAGCGSSREHAVWALADYGFRVVIAESFASIFYDNCVANGILPVRLSRPALNLIAERVCIDAQRNLVLADLTSTTLTVCGESFSFEIAPLAHRMLQNGLSPIDLTLEDLDLIESFACRDAVQRKWLYPVASD